MIQVATLLGSVISGLRDSRYPKGKAIYAVRTGEHFLYIGRTRNGAWRRIRSHILRAENDLGTAARTQWLIAANWRVEVCYFSDAVDTKLLERTLIRQYCPPFNRAHNVGIPTTSGVSNAAQDVAAIDISDQWMLIHGWPSFRDIALEPPAWQQRLDRSRTRGRAR